MTDDTKPDETPAAEPAVATEPEPKRAPAKKAPAARKAKAQTATVTKPSGPRGKCAGCGDDVVLDETTTVGSRTPIVHHGCEAMTAIIRRFALDVLVDPSTPLPAATK